MKKSAKKTGIYRAFEFGGKKLKDIFVKKTKSNDVPKEIVKINDSLIFLKIFEN